MKLRIALVLLVVSVLMLACTPPGTAPAGSYAPPSSSKPASSPVTTQSSPETASPSASEEPAYSSTLHKVKGTSTGTVPYASVDQAQVRARTITKDGGVVEASLAKNVKVFVIIPPGEVIESAKVAILPYTAMPSGPQHPALSDELGYGAQVFIESIQTGIRAFVIFDLDGGNAAKKVARSEGYYNRCDPSKKWFNPLICARGKKVDPASGINKNYAVISPIHTQQYNTLVFTRNTIPLGMEGLIAAEVKGGDVYVPQKVDQALAADLVRSTIGRYSNNAEQVEAAEFALAWNIPFSREQAEDVVDAVNAAETYSQMVEAYFIADEMVQYAGRQTSLDENEAEEWVNLKSDAKVAADQAKATLFQEASSDTSSAFDDTSVEAGSAVGGLADNGVAGADAAVSDVEGNLQNGIESNSQSSDAGRAGEAIDAGEAAQRANPKVIDIPPTANSVKNAINNVLNNPQSSIQSLLKAAGLAQLWGFDDLANKAIEKIKKLLEDLLTNSGLSQKGLYDAASIAQAVGADNLAEQFLDRASKLLDETCESLIKKSLRNFGINECK